MAVSGLKLKTLTAVTVTTAGTRVPLSATTVNVYAVTIISMSSNTGTQYLGDSTVTSSNGLPFGPGEDVELDAPDVKGLDQFDISKIYLDSSSSAAAFRVIAWIRE
jgi:hypothetical protein